jgi:hypothetical protein
MTKSWGAKTKIYAEKYILSCRAGGRRSVRNKRRKMKGGVERYCIVGQGFRV